jgi:hypothetical protein
MCAIDMGNGKLTAADPNAGAIHEDKLYLFGAKEGVPMFEQDPESYIRKSTARYSQLK